MTHACVPCALAYTPRGTDEDCPVCGSDGRGHRRPRPVGVLRNAAARIEALEWVRLTKPNDEEIATAIENLRRGGV